MCIPVFITVTNCDKQIFDDLIRLLNILFDWEKILISEETSLVNLLNHGEHHQRDHQCL